jgi:hypothetical protein
MALFVQSANAGADFAEQTERARASAEGIDENSFQLRRSAMTRIAYVTTDELNEADAAPLAGKCRAEIHAVLLRDPPPNGEFDAILYDLDYLPVERRQVVLAELLAGPPHSLVGVHSLQPGREARRGAAPQPCRCRTPPG